MAIKNLNIVNMLVTDYNDADVPLAIDTNGRVRVTQAPTAGDEVLRLDDVGGTAADDIKRLATIYGFL